MVPADEDHPVRPLSPYGTSKFSFEQYLGTFKRTFGLEFTVLRYANIYGPRQDFYAEEGRVVAIFAAEAASRRAAATGDLATVCAPWASCLEKLRETQQLVAVLSR